MAKKVTKKKEAIDPKKQFLESVFGANLSTVEEAAKTLNQPVEEYINGVVVKNANGLLRLKAKASVAPDAEPAPVKELAPVVPVAPVETAPKPAVVEEVTTKSLPVIKRKIKHPCRNFNPDGTDVRFLKAEYNGTCLVKGNQACFWSFQTARNCPTYRSLPGSPR